MADEALRAARKVEWEVGKTTGRPKPVVSYLCNQCRKYFKRKDVAKDHVEPVTPLSGWKESVILKRMFVGSVAGYQVLCKPCHKKKTLVENKKRRGA